MEVKTQKGTLTLQQMVTEPNMWRLMMQSPGPFNSSAAEEFVGLMLVYVDDLLNLSSEDIAQDLIQAIRAKWETSQPEKVGMVKEVRFLGAELWRRDDGAWIMTQTNYIKDLLKRNLGADSSTWPCRKIPMTKEPDIAEDGQERTPASVKEAQRVIGELVWITARTRPDLSFAVSKLASIITKDPEQVIQSVKSIWYYLASTMDQGLIFHNGKGERQLNVYTDASYSEVLEGALAGDAVKVVLEEALDVIARSFSFTDSSAALSIIAGDTGSWRTRHLRKRANILRVKVLGGEWLLRHVPGAEMPADLGTKVLTVQKFNQHKKAMGMFLEEIERKDDQGGAVAGMSLEAKERALKLIIFVTQMAMAQSAYSEEKEFSQELAVWSGTFVQWKQPTNYFFLIVFAAVILAVGVILGACIMGCFFWHRVDKVTVVQYKGFFINIPAFLYKVFQKTEPEIKRTADLDARSAAMTSAAMLDSSTAGAVQGAAGGEPRSTAGAGVGVAAADIRRRTAVGAKRGAANGRQSSTAGALRAAAANGPGSTAGAGHGAASGSSGGYSAAGAGNGSSGSAAGAGGTSTAGAGPAASSSSAGADGNVRDRLAFRDVESPCIVPNGKYIFRGCVLSASDFCALKGLAEEDQVRFGLTMFSPNLMDNQTCLLCCHGRMNLGPDDGLVKELQLTPCWPRTQSTTSRVWSLWGGWRGLCFQLI
eukprot:s3094_g6.t1